MRERLYSILEPVQERSKISRIYDGLMIVVIVVSLVPLCIKEETALLKMLDLVTVTVFIVDYCLRWMTADLKYHNRSIASFVRYPLSAMAIIDLLAILPSFGFLTAGLKTLKMFRLFRALRFLRTIKVLKVLKLARYSKSVRIVFAVIKSQKEALLTVAGFAVSYIVLSALIIFNVEPDTFESFFDAVYWACVSLTTVGYGDIYPVTTAGRIVAMLSSVVGIAIIALPSGIITAGYMEIVQNRTKQ